MNPLLPTLAPVVIIDETEQQFLFQVPIFLRFNVHLLA